MAKALVKRKMARHGLRRRTISALPRRKIGRPPVKPAHGPVHRPVHRIAHKIRMERVFDLLSEVLALERGGIQFYGLAKDRSNIPDVRATLERFLGETERHVDLLQTTIRELGGNPVYISPAADIQQQRIRAILDLNVAPRYQSVADIENILLKETKDLANWEFMRSIVPYIEDERAQNLIQKLVDEIEDEERDHEKWAKEAFNRVMLQFMTQPVEAREAA